MCKITKRHLELRIAYLRDKISQLPHGFFSEYQGRNAVYLFYDPDNSKISRNNKRRYYVTSKRGRVLSELINEYLILKKDLDAALSLWKTNFAGNPRKYRFPLTKIKPDRFDHDFYENSQPNQNPREIKNPVKYKGHTFRSKNEFIVAQIVEKMGYEYKEEILIQFDDYTYFFPDITFYVPEVDKVIIVEVDGAMDKSQYVGKSYHNTAACVTNKLVEMKDFVVVRIGDAYSINAEQIEKMLYSAIDSAIDDLVLTRE